MPERAFRPLDGAPRTTKNRYVVLAKRAETSYQAASRLFCIECVGWSPIEAKKCTANQCPLWAVNRKNFKHGVDKGAGDA